MIFLAKGHCYLGRRRIDKDGNVVEESAARFEPDTDGGSVAVGVMDLDTMQVTGQTEIFGDFDPWGYLGHALKLLAPSRAGNIPDFENMFKKAYQDHGNTDCPMLYYCERPAATTVLCIVGWRRLTRMKIEQITPRLVTIKLTQEKTDPDYGSCLWAVFQLDLDAYRMQVMSDCGNYAYGWCPTPNAESFLHLVGRMDEDYLLEKISDRTVVDTKATYKAVTEYLNGLLDAEDVTEGYSDEQISAACRTYYPRDCLAELMEALAFTDYGDAADQFELSECIETDYPAGAKRIVALFRDYIRPMARKMDEEGRA